MAEKGYIKLARKSIESDIWRKPPLYWKIWTYILMRAYYEDTDGLKKGELLFTIDELREAGSYFVGYRKVLPSKKQIRAILDYLRRTDEGTAKGYTKGTMMVTTKGTTGMLGKVLKYGTYQASETYEGAHEGNNEGAHERTTKGAKRAHLNKKKKKEEKEEEKVIAEQRSAYASLPSSSGSLLTPKETQKKKIELPNYIEAAKRGIYAEGHKLTEQEAERLKSKARRNETE